MKYDCAKIITAKEYTKSFFLCNNSINHFPPAYNFEFIHIEVHQMIHLIRPTMQVYIRILYMIQPPEQWRVVFKIISEYRWYSAASHSIIPLSEMITVLEEWSLREGLNLRSFSSSLNIMNMKNEWLRETVGILQKEEHWCNWLSSRKINY